MAEIQKNIGHPFLDLILILYSDNKIRPPMFYILRTTNNNITHGLLFTTRNEEIYVFN